MNTVNPSWHRNKKLFSFNPPLPLSAGAYKQLIEGQTHTERQPLTLTCVLLHTRPQFIYTCMSFGYCVPQNKYINIVVFVNEVLCINMHNISTFSYHSMEEKCWSVALKYRLILHNKVGGWSKLCVYAFPNTQTHVERWLMTGFRWCATRRAG